MRIFIAGLIGAAALGGGLVMHNYGLQTETSCVRYEGPSTFVPSVSPVSLYCRTITERARWQDSAAIAIGAIGLGAVGGVLTTRRRLRAERRLRLQ
jgi:hypothetical protein